MKDAFQEHVINCSPLLGQSNLATDYIHNELERPKQLTNYDLRLRRTADDCHLPLIVRVHAHATRNFRTRSFQSQAKRLDREATRTGKGKGGEREFSRQSGNGSSSHYGEIVPSIILEGQS